MSEVHADPEKQARAEKFFGSHEHYMAAGHVLGKEYETNKEYLKQAVRHKSEETLFEALGKLPIWADPFRLAELPLHLIGVPAELSVKNDELAISLEARRKRLPASEEDCPDGNELRCMDYTNHGWPRTEGSPRRYVTPEEDLAILSRLSRSGLTVPGSAYPTRARTLAELFEEDLPTPMWLIDGFVREGGAAMIFGPSGVGKTFLVETLVLMLAGGRGVGIRDTSVKDTATGEYEWALKCGPHNGVKVCLLDGEMIEADQTARMRFLCRALGCVPISQRQAAPPMDVEQLALVMQAENMPPEEIELWVNHWKRRNASDAVRPAVIQPQEDGPTIDLDNIITFSKAAQDHRTTFVDLADPQWRGLIVEYGKAQGIKAFVFDNLSTLSPSLEDENASVAWQPLNDLIVALKREGIASIIVHHTGKSGDTYRGSSNLKTTLETAIGLKKVQRATGGAAAFTVFSEKNRLRDEAPIIGRTLVLGPEGWLVEDDAFEDVDAVVEAVKSLRYGSQEDVAEALWGKRSLQPRVSKALMVANEQGRLQRPQVKEYFKKAKALRNNPVFESFEDEPPLDYSAPF